MSAIAADGGSLYDDCHVESAAEDTVCLLNLTTTLNDGVYNSYMNLLTAERDTLEPVEGSILEHVAGASRTLHRFIGDLTEIFLNLRNPRNKSFLELNLEQAHIIEELSALLPTLHPFLPPSPLAIRADPITTPHTILDNYSTAPVGRYVPPTTSMPGYVEYTPTSTTGSRTSILQPQHLSLSTRQATLPPVFPSIRSRVRRTDEERLEMETVRVKVEDQLDRLEQEAGLLTRHQDERKTGGETGRGTTPAREIKWTAPMGVRRP